MKYSSKRRKKKNNEKAERIPIGFMIYQQGNYMNFQSPKRRKEKGEESSFKEIMAEIFPNLEREIDIQINEI